MDKAEIAFFLSHDDIFGHFILFFSEYILLFYLPFCEALLDTTSVGYVLVPKEYLTVMVTYALTYATACYHMLRELKV